MGATVEYEDQSDTTRDLRETATGVDEKLFGLGVVGGRGSA